MVINSLSGGVLIGLGAACLLGINGRLAGISGITWRFLFTAGKDAKWQGFFLTGLIGGAALYYKLFGGAPVARETFPLGLLMVSGLLVGYGTSLGKGCTSGHGVCGLGRLSLRSLAATLTFLLVAIITTFVVRHIIGIR
jgi:hypothetical protein